MAAPYPAPESSGVRLQATADPDIVILLGDDAPGELSEHAMGSMVARLQAAPDLDAVGPIVPVADAHKVVDTDELVVATLDRSTLGFLGRPAAVRRAALERNEIDRVAPW